MNYEIINDKDEQTEIIHHNRLSPASNSILTRRPTRRPNYKEANVYKRKFVHVASSESSTGSKENDPIDPLLNRKYPQRNRIPRQIEGTLPWTWHDKLESQAHDFSCV